MRGPSLAVAFTMLKGFGGLALIQERLETLVFTHLVSTSRSCSTPVPPRRLGRSPARPRNT